MKLKSPFPWIGGKSSIMPTIWRDYLGDPLNLVVPFGGSFADLWTRPHWDIEQGVFTSGRPYRTETVNDANAFLINAFRAIHADPEAVAKWCDWPVVEADQHAVHAWLCGFTPEPDTVPSEFDKPQLREAWLAGWQASYRPFDPLAFRERVMSDPSYYDPQAAGRWVWGQCVWIGSGWCDWEVIERRGRLERKRTNVHQTGILRKDVRLSPSRPTLRPAQGIQSFRLKRQRPHITDGRGIVSLAKQIPMLSGNRGARGTGVTSARLRYNEGLVYFMQILAARLRNVHVVCGGWDRVLSPSATYLIGTTAIILDPPYDSPDRDPHLYAVEDKVLLRGRKDGDKSLSQAAREWALANGDNPKLRVVLFGHETEHGPHMPESWRCVAWKGPGGYGNRNSDNQNRHAERVWLSPHCQHPEHHIVVRPPRPIQTSLFNTQGAANG